MCFVRVAAIKNKNWYGCVGRKALVNFLWQYKSFKGYRKQFGCPSEKQDIELLYDLAI